MRSKNLRQLPNPLDWLVPISHIKIAIAIDSQSGAKQSFPFGGRKTGITALDSGGLDT